ncbi:general transcription factor IIH subunit 3 isoform X3 [Monomorium pharaonis]|uniref:general transcription factor IIH subunit 3 isoform X3 n=1 Tax=Monomorium pharaonis TaxID=307658 RepID=UPI001747A473|nr:general transcription factor IIH subunit 3 isoform X3 [Monomorium pharaonis]
MSYQVLDLNDYYLISRGRAALFSARFVSCKNTSNEHSFINICTSAAKLNNYLFVYILFIIIYLEICRNRDELAGDRSGSEIRQMDDQYEKFTMMEHTVRQQLQRIISENILLWAFPMNIPLNISLISGALNMALCYIARLKSEKIASQKLHPRILVITASNDSATQYMNYMNIFFTAQRMNVILDVCSLDQELTLLQQGCDITGGNYLKVPQLDELLQDLLCVFLPDPSVRSELVLPSPVKVDYRAACFCHQELIDIGYVCSKCFTIFCKFNSICTTCHTVFKMPGRMSMKMKNKSMCGSRRTLFVYSVTVEYLKQQRLKDIVKYVIWIMKCFAALIIFLNLYYNSLYDTIPIDLRIHGITFDGNQTTYCSGPPSKDTI